MKEKVGFIVLLLTQAAVASTELDVICSSQSILAAVGEDVILPCQVQPQLDATNMTVMWRHERLNHTVHLYQDNRVEQGEDFEGRTSLFHEGLTKGNLSLNLSTVRVSDTGRYRCSFITDELQSSCSVNLTVVPEREGNSTEQIADSRNISIGIIVGIVIVGIVIFCTICVALHGWKRGICKAAGCLIECLAIFLDEMVYMMRSETFI